MSQFNTLALSHFETLDYFARTVAANEYYQDRKSGAVDGSDRVDIFTIYSISQRTQEIESDVAKNREVLSNFWGCARSHYENCQGMTVKNLNGLVAATIDQSITSDLYEVLKVTINDSYPVDRRGYTFTSYSYDKDNGTFSAVLKAPPEKMTHASPFSPSRRFILSV